MLIFPHSSLQKRSKCVWLRGHLLCTARFRSPHTASIGFWSGPFHNFRRPLEKPLSCSFECMLSVRLWRMSLLGDFIYVFAHFNQAWRFFFAKKCLATLRIAQTYEGYGRLLSCRKQPEIPAAPLLLLQASRFLPDQFPPCLFNQFWRDVQFLVMSLLCHISATWWQSSLCSM